MTEATISDASSREPGLLQFASWVAVKGYYCVGLEPEREGFAPKQVLVPAGKKIRPTAPLESKLVLFRIFSELRPNVEDILGFANEHGFLRNQWQAGLHSQIGVRIERFGGYGELISQWAEQIRDMRNAVAIWEAIDSPNLDASRALLNAAVRIKDGFATFRGAGARYRFGTHQTFRGRTRKDDLFPYLEDADEARIARWALIRIANDKLERYASPQLFYDPEQDKACLRFSATCLLGAMWVQFGWAIDGARDYRQCPACSNWFFVSPETNRKHRVYCSDTCRVRNHRERKEQARKHHAAGWPAKRIAKELGTRTDVVRRWIAIDEKRKL